MPSYNAPLRDMRFVMFELLDAERELQAMPRFAGIDRETIDAVLEEAARFASQVAFPLNAVGDIEGCTYHGDGVVTAPPGFKEAYRQYGEAGWPALSCDPAYGGQGLPVLLNNRLYEMLNSANQAWLMYSGLSHSAYECLLAFGTEAQRNTYLPKLVSGQWSGTMCLTEAQCGTDLGMLKTRAEPIGDGSFALTGSKIFISAGEHDVAENILHLVLGRLPDAPAGTRGISLFLVPKFLPDATGGIGERNRVKAGSIEHKMGIHGNATCVINLDGARGWLIGEPHKGLSAMFVMMNSARLGVAMQSLGLAEVSLQNAVSYARERIQGRAATGAKQPDKAADSIMVHPDVRRMLFTCKAYTEAGRAMTTWTALLTDREQSHPDPAVRAEAGELIALLTPINKAFVTDNAFETCNLALQVLGGHGYIREWGMEQYVRDARINMIYEGSNGIQALDLLGRKVLGGGGASLLALAGRIEETVARATDLGGEPAAHAASLKAMVDRLGEVTFALAGLGDPERTMANATVYLEAAGHVVIAWMWLEQLVAVGEKEGDFYDGKRAAARYFFGWELPKVTPMLDLLASGDTTTLEMRDAWF
jgi:alkylation response protein AidB-like acyl-CoA dehydrogenase